MPGTSYSSRCKQKLIFSDFQKTASNQKRKKFGVRISRSEIWNKGRRVFQVFRAEFQFEEIFFERHNQRSTPKRPKNYFFMVSYWMRILAFRIVEV